jgi:hypothetical protein
MKTRTLFILVAFLFAISYSAEAQVNNLLKNKMNKVINAGARTANKEIDNKIDTAVNKEADKVREKGDARVEANRKNNSSGQPTQAESSESAPAPSSGGGLNLGKLMANKVDLKYKEEYSFTSKIYMVSESYDKDEVIKMDFNMYYSATSPSVGVETKTIANNEGEVAPITSTMVMDGENKCFMALTDINGMKMGIISAAPDENSIGATDKNGKPVQPPTFTKTGNTREIAGYKCDEYSYKDTENKTTGKVWFTKDARLKIDRRGWQNSNMSAYYGNPEFNNGVILANEAYDSKGKLQMKMETKEIVENFPHTVSVKGYSLRQMNLNKKDDKKK